MSFRVGEKMEVLGGWHALPHLLYSAFLPSGCSEFIPFTKVQIQVSTRDFQVFLKVNNPGKMVVRTPVSDRSVRRETEAEEAICSQVDIQDCSLNLWDVF